MTTNTPITEYTLLADDGPDLILQGSLLAKVSNKTISLTNAKPTELQRWTELALYKSQSGKLVGHKKQCTDLPNEILQYSVIIADDEEHLCLNFGYGPLEKRLYNASGIHHQRCID